ncbi:hypothetical protein GCM10010399_56410 [Dactylosporangium fulvum]
MARVSIKPRPLNEAERRVLSVEFDGVQELRSQIGLATVVATWSPGSASVDLRVAGGSNRSRQRNGCVPVDAAVSTSAKSSSGWMRDQFPHWSTRGVTDEMPTTLPQIDRIKVRRRE